MEPILQRDDEEDEPSAEFERWLQTLPSWQPMDFNEFSLMIGARHLTVQRNNPCVEQMAGPSGSYAVSLVHRSCFCVRYFLMQKHMVAGHRS